MMTGALHVTCMIWMFASGVLAAKAGDKGKGWKVIERDTENGYVELRCIYDGKFRIQGADREYWVANGYASDAVRQCPSPIPFITREGGQTVSLGQGKKSTVWRIKTPRNGPETIRSATNRKYLTPLTDVRTTDWDTDVVMGLKKKKWTYSIKGEDRQGEDGQWDEIDCLNGVTLLSESYTYISYDCASGEFRYDSDEANSWNLIPIE